MRLWLLFGVAALLRRDCPSRLQQALAAAEAEPAVAAAPQGAPLRQDRALARVFWALQDGCAQEYRRWERSRLPAECRAKFDAFASEGVPASAPLAPWRDPARSNSTAIAYLVSVSDPEALPLVLRTFRRLHRPGDTFLYLVDSKAAPGYAVKLEAALEAAIPRSGAKVLPARDHSVMYFYPRVDAVLDGLRTLVSEGQWSYAVHLSEHDYPLHRAALHELAARTEPRERRLVLDSVPRRTNGREDDWYWWRQHTAVFVCGDHAAPDPGVTFPDESLPLARGSEWFALPREVVEYVVAPPAAAAPGVQSFVDVMKHRWSVDEVFWPTLLRAVPGLERPQQPGWYVQWDAQHGHSPDTFVGATLASHRAAILDSDRLFVRKVSLPGSKELLDTLDTRP